MKKYKIQLFDFIEDDGKNYFLWATSSELEPDLKSIKSTGKPVTYNKIPTTSDKFDKEEDLDLMMAKVWESRLVELGINCKIVEIDYSEEN